MEFIKTKIWARILAMLLCGALVFSLVACAGKANTNLEGEEEEESEEVIIVKVSGAQKNNDESGDEGDTSDGATASGGSQAAKPVSRMSIGASQILRKDTTKQTVKDFADLKGKKVRIAASGGFFSLAGDASKLKGSALERRKIIDKVKKDYGIDWEYKSYPTFELANIMATAVYAGNDFADIVTTYTHQIGNFINLKLWKDLNEVKEINMKNGKFWVQNLLSQTRIYGKNLFVFPTFKNPGDTAGCIMFNKTILNKVGSSPEQLYKLVKEKKWTFTEMRRLSSKAWSDDDGVPGLSKGDTFGFVGVDLIGGIAKNVFIAAGGEAASRTADGGYQCIMNDPKNINALTLMQNWIAKDKAVFTIGDAIGDWPAQIKKFDDGKALFYLAEPYDYPGQKSGVKNYKAGYGFIPFPVPREGTNYKSGINHNNEVLAFPYNASPDSSAMAGLWLELVIPEFKKVYDKELNDKKSLVKEADKKEIFEMCDLIRDTGYLDPMYWGVCDAAGTIHTLIKSPSISPGSQVQKELSKMQQSTKEFLTAVKALK